MKTSPNTLRIGIAVAVIVGTIAWLAYSGYGANKSYYVTIGELTGMGDKAYHSQLRVEGFVQPGSVAMPGLGVNCSQSISKNGSASTTESGQSSKAWIFSSSCVTRMRSKRRIILRL